MGEVGDRAGDWSRDLDRDLDGEKNLLNAMDARGSMAKCQAYRDVVRKEAQGG